VNISFSRRALAAVTVLALGGSLATVTVAEAGRPRCLGRRATHVGTNGADRIRGTGGADVIVAKGGSDLVVGRGGNDRICSGGGSDAVRAGAGDDRVAAGQGHDFVTGRAGNDRIFLEGGFEEAAFGGGGNDVIDLGPGAFQFALGGGGDDEIIGFDPEPGGFSFDFTSYFNAPGAVTVDLAAGTATGHGTDTLTSIEGVEGSEFDDTLTGTPGSNFLFGFAGNDTINSAGNAGSLDDPYNVTQDFNFDAMGGDDGDDILNGGAGVNVLFFDTATGPVNVDLQAGTASGQGDDTLSDINAAIGSEFDDTLVGSNGTDALDGFTGNNTIDGRGGEDVLVAVDAILMTTVNLQEGTATGHYQVFEDEEGPPQLAPFSHTLTNMENVWGSDLAVDVLTGDDGPNELFGLGRNDQLSGAGGDDYLDGGLGNDDQLNGGDGTDTCVDGETNDACETVQEGGLRLARRLFAGVYGAMRFSFLQLAR
jgi:Ca2+-binding RTX toxin-like protein